MSNIKTIISERIDAKKVAGENGRKLREKESFVYKSKIAELSPVILKTLRDIGDTLSEKHIWFFRRYKVYGFWQSGVYGWDLVGTSKLLNYYGITVFLRVLPGDQMLLEICHSCSCQNIKIAYSESKTQKIETPDCTRAGFEIAMKEYVNKFVLV